MLLEEHLALFSVVTADGGLVQQYWCWAYQVSGSGICWAVCTSAPHPRQITMPAPHHSVFLQAECPSCRPTNSVKALKVDDQYCY